MEPESPCLTRDTHFERHVDYEYTECLPARDLHLTAICMPQSAQQQLPPHATMPQTCIALQKRGISPQEVPS
jgi:hypothetical protein